MKKIIILIMLLLFSSSAFASYNCTNETHSRFNLTVEVANIPTSISYLELCKFNCTNSTGQCAPSPYDVNMGSIGIVLVVSALAYLFIYLANHSTFTMNFGKFEFDPLQLLYFGLALFMIIIDFSLAMNFAQNENLTSATSILTPGWNGLIWAFVFIAFIILVLFVWSVFKTIIDMGKRKGK